MSGVNRLGVSWPGQCCEAYCVEELDLHNVSADEAGRAALPKRPARVGGDFGPAVATLPTVGKPNMIMRSIRVRLELWNAAKAKADERQENISDVIREALERYVKRKP